MWFHFHDIVTFLCVKKRKPRRVAEELAKPCKLRYYQLLFDFRQGV